jgi:cytochrome c nitrite reductase small subunit
MPWTTMALKGTQRAGIAAIAALGVAAGLGLFTFGYARGASYLTNDPAACANCHIMSEHFAAWQRASHRAAATCNDCHAPHNFVGKYVTKARNGFWHSFYFTTGTYPDPLHITERNRSITESACRYCHAEIVDAIDPSDSRHSARGEALSCIRCHTYVGHWVR